MKQVLTTLTALLALSLSLHAAVNSENVSAVAQSPALLGDYIGDADADAAAEFTAAVIQKVEQSEDLSDEEKESIVLDLVTRYTILAGENAPAWLASLVDALGNYDRLPAVVAAAMLAGGDQADAIWAAMEPRIAALGDDDLLARAREAAADPAAYLGAMRTGVISEVLKALGYGGVITQPAPPPPQSPPPAAPAYPGQQ